MESKTLQRKIETHDDNVTITTIRTAFANIYYYCHPWPEQDLSHQAVRALHFISKESAPSVSALADHLQCAQNTASEIAKRLRTKNMISQDRRSDDTRMVVLTLTPHGKKTLDDHTTLDTDRLRSVWETLSPDERKTLTAAFTIFSHRCDELFGSNEAASNNRSELPTTKRKEPHPGDPSSEI